MTACARLTEAREDRANRGLRRTPVIDIKSPSITPTSPRIARWRRWIRISRCSIGRHSGVRKPGKIPRPAGRNRNPMFGGAATMSIEGASEKISGRACYLHCSVRGYRRRDVGSSNDSAWSLSCLSSRALAWRSHSDVGRGLLTRRGMRWRRSTRSKSRRPSPAA